MRELRKYQSGNPGGKEANRSYPHMSGVGPLLYCFVSRILPRCADTDYLQRKSFRGDLRHLPAVLEHKLIDGDAILASLYVMIGTK